jgi:hypothetical protein
VGLESCVLKVLTLLIDRRLKEWAAVNDVLPDSQNGFRETFRTHDNSFIVCAAVESTRAMGKTLFVAFIDLENAFPSTDLPNLWTKLYQAGVSGPIFDWCRMLYKKMSYIVRHAGAHSSSFKSLIGVLTGDTVSPALWNIYFADLEIPDDPDDVILDGRHVSHVEQADDVALLSTSTRGLQCKINHFLIWCCLNFTIISAIKSKWMAIGPLTGRLPVLYVAEEIIELVSSYKYVGLVFSSTHRHIFAMNYPIKAAKARNMANAMFAVDSMVGCLPPFEGICLYMAQIDPHLIAGCEVCLDVDMGLLGELKDVQHMFLRRLLGLNCRSLVDVLFTEAGVMPIQYRRVKLALKYLIYLLQLPPNRLAGLLCTSLWNSGMKGNLPGCLTSAMCFRNFLKQ